MTQPIIQLKGFDKFFGDFAALSQVDLDIKTGEFFSLLGPSGCGKTTLLRLCYMQLMPTSGHVRIFGTDVRGLGRDDIALMRRRVGVVHQDVKFLDHLPLTENIALPLNDSGRQAEAGGTDLEELMSWVGLTNRAEALPPELLPLELTIRRLFELEDGVITL